ncbi:MAG: ADP-ribosylglycohydrolase family protein [Fimbriimonadaceae bacterium]|nr:ADP-ribosylglycohydrolase family protein [Fimbriimonadaceae bacterium]
MSELVRQAVKGAVVGWTLGAAQRGKKAYTRLTFYDPVPLRMAQSDALDAWHLWAAHLRGGKSPETLADTWSACWRGRSEEGGFGLMNLRRGLRPGLSGAFANPLGEGSEAMGRAVFWGLAFHGDPATAARWAVADASIDHFGDGVSVPAVVAWWVAAARPGTSVTELVAAANAILPVESLATRSVQAALAKSGDPDAAKNLLLTLPVQLGLVDPSHAALTLCWVLCGLSAGSGTWGTAPLVAAGCGAASDHGGLVAGTLATLLSGTVPDEWTGVLGDDYVSGHALSGIDASRTLTALADLVPETAVPTQAEVVTDSVVPVDQGGAPQTPLPPTPGPEIAALVAATAKTLTARVGDAQVDVIYHSPPAVKAGGSLQLQVVVTNKSEADLAIEPRLSVPDGWQVAHRLAPFRAQPGKSTSFVLVAQAPADWSPRPEQITLHLGEADFPMPVLAAEQWYVIGPFANTEDLGYEKVYAPETEQRADQALSSRSGLPLRWRAEHLPGTAFEVEPYFEGGPGVVYLFATAHLPRPGHHRVFAACDAGVMVWVDGKKCVGYFDRTKPVPRFGPPYIGECQVSDATTVLVKVVRGREPVGTLYLSFYNEDGEVVSLSGFGVLT